MLGYVKFLNLKWRIFQMLNLEFHVHPFARNAAINNKDPKKLCGEFLNRMIETRLVDTKNILRVHLQSDMDYEDSTAFQSLKNYQRSVIPSDFTRSLALEKTGKGRVLTNKGDKIELDEKPVSHSFACLYTAADGFTELICSYDSSMTRILKTVARDNGANTVYWPIKVPKTVLDLVKNDRRAYCEDLTKLINRLNIKSCYEIRSTIHILPSENDFDEFINSCEIYDIDARRVFDVSLGFFDLEYEQPEWSTIGYHQHFDQGEHISDEQIANVSSDDSFDATPVKSIVMNETARVGSFEFLEQKEIDNVNSNDKLLEKEAITHFESQSPFSFDVVESQGVLRSTRNDEQSDKLQDISADNDAHSFDSFDQIGTEHNEQVAEPAIQQQIIGVDAIISSNHYTEGELLNTNSSSLVLMALNASAMVKTQGELRLASTDEQKVDNDAASFDSFSQIETQHNEQSAEKVVMRVDADVAEYNKQKEIEIIQVVTATSRQSDSTGNDVEVIEKNSEKDAQKLTKEGATEKTKSVKRVLKESEEGVVEKKSRNGANQQCEMEDDIEISVERRHECEAIAISLRQLLLNTRTRGRLIRVLDAQKLSRMA
ncbi:hypothetical protein CRE_29232 [Caenorhabditis remanei]|uniref:Uncharacterized protein n=1 Tax=Caenorhabditis remanei TaxID=31234 RepID=E3NKI5_CAERE|nr:hypothetical protein CRE_29232 [Caenorhabditis remanei]